MTIVHKNTGSCDKCIEIFNKYPKFYTDLYYWFINLQKQYPEIHISCAGRGQADQDQLYFRGASRAKWKQSAHNYNAAIDVFFNIIGSKEIYPLDKFKNILQPNLPAWCEWYGDPNARFHELPHIEVRGWSQLAVNGVINLVE